MTSQANDRWQIGRWQVDPAAGRVSSGAREHVLRPKEMALLVHLAERAGEVVSPDEIMSVVWRGVEVTNDSLYFSISQLRKRLDGPRDATSVIETMPKRGYRLAVPARRLAGVSGDTPERPVSSGRRSRRSAAAIGLAAVVAGFVIASWPWLSDWNDRSGPDAAGQTSIAVMPFIDLSPAADYTYFSDGITDEILNRLARVPGIQVAARTSSFAFKGKEASVAAIGDALGVETILEGSVRKDGETVRVSVQLIDAQTGFQVWSETYERELTGIFDIQNDISHSIARTLRLALAPPVPDTTVVVDARAVDAYLHGLEALRITSFEAYRQAIDYFETALRIDPDFTQAMVQLADARLGLFRAGASNNTDLIDQAEALAERALARDDGSGPAWRILGLVSRWRGEWADARELIQKSLELVPSDPVSMVALGEIHIMSNELEEADEMFRRAMRVDPYGAAPMTKHAMLSQRLGRLDEARATIQRAYELHPDNPNLPWMLGRFQVGEQGDLAGGLQNFLRAAALDPEDYEIAAYVAMTYLTLGLPDEAKSWVERARTLGPGTPATRAVEASLLQITGDTAEATRLAVDTIRGRSYRLLFHEMLTDSLITIAAGNLEKQGRADEAIDLFSNNLPAITASLGPGDTVYYDGGAAVMNKFSENWSIALAGLYARRGDIGDAEKLIRATLDSRAQNPLDTDTAYRGDYYLTDARIAAIRGDDQSAIRLLRDAVARNLLFAWQLQISADPAFRHLYADPGFIDIVQILDDTIERQRTILQPERSSLATRNTSAAPATSELAPPIHAPR